MPIVPGDDHTLPYPVVQAFDKAMHVIQLDAHLDYSDAVQDMTPASLTELPQ